MAASKYDLSNWSKGKVTLFQALGLKSATYPAFGPRLLAGATINNPGPASFGATSNIGGGASNNATGAPISTKGLTNPIGPGLIPGRVDMGVDYSGAGPLYALGSGTIVNVYQSGWPGGIFIALKLDQDGRYVYYAENISPQVRVNQKVQAGDLIGYANGQYPYIEIGWAAPPGTGGVTMAASTGQDKAGLASEDNDPGEYSTAYGVAFNQLLQSLGAKPGSINPPVQGSVPSGWS
jgi:Peptidase family M23